MTDITPLIWYEKEIAGGNSHSRWLSRVFGVDFKAFMRAGYCVDAVLEQEEGLEGIAQKLSEKQIRVRQVRNRLVVPNVNTIPVAENIRKL